MSYTIASQFIRDNLTWLAFMSSQQPLKEPLCGPSVPPLLEKYINYFSVLINGSPQIMLLSLDLQEDLINEERVTISLMFSPKVSRKSGSKFVAP